LLLALALTACGPQPALPAPSASASIARPALVDAAVPDDAAAPAEAVTPPLADAPVPDAPCDLLLQHARLLDPGSGRDGLFDLSITGGRIARIAPTLDPSRAARVLDLRGLLVTPGLVDLHTHVFSGSEANHYLAGTTLAASADEAAPRSCTTTVVDAGSAGHRSFPAFARVIARSRTRILAFLNIVGEGMRGGRHEQDLADMSADATAAALLAHPELLVGIKVAHYAGPGWEPIDRALVAAQRAGVPVMVDFGGHVPALSLEELLLHRLRPGDLFTHAFASVRGRTALVDAAGLLHPYARTAQARGLRFDLGYGGKSFSFSQAAPAMRQGFLPDTLSTDMHRTSLRGSMHDLPGVLSKLGALGMSLPEQIRRSTAAPAQAIGRPALGRLVEGGEADLAVFSVETGHFTFTDTEGATIPGKERLACELTLRAGEVVWDPKKRLPP
jgi:dihydroorotase